jgi:hypothetical protein
VNGWHHVDADEAPRLAEAIDWMLSVLSAGPVESTELMLKARADGIAWRTAQRAKHSLGVRSHRHGFATGGHWVCALPAGTSALKQEIANARN